MGFLKFGRKGLAFKGSKQVSVGKRIGSGWCNSRTASKILVEKQGIGKAKRELSKVRTYETGLRKSYDQEISEREKRIKGLKSKFL